MRILLTGKNGQLGRCFQDKSIDTKHELFAYGSSQLDIADLDSVVTTISQVKPDIIVNAAAYTAVDKAEVEKESAYAVNELGVKNLAKQAALLDIPLVHISTDYVFDGDAVDPYQPNSKANPQSVYGASKLAGEHAVQFLCEKYIVLRTAWVFSEYGNNFVKTMVKLAKDRDHIQVVADQYGCPTYAGDLAHAILELCDQYESNQSLAWGVYHYCGDSLTSWHGFARTIFTKAKTYGMIEKRPHLTAIGSEQYPTAATRPEYSVMSTQALHLLNVKPSSWCSSLESVLQKLKP